MKILNLNISGASMDQVLNEINFIQNQLWIIGMIIIGCIVVYLFHDFEPWV